MHSSKDQTKIKSISPKLNSNKLNAMLDTSYDPSSTVLEGDFILYKV